MVAVENLLGRAVYHLPPRRRPVVIYSSMRSGSTLLKALLGTNPQVSHVPEVHYGNWPLRRYAFYLRLWWLAREPVVVLKRPCFYSDVPHYPFLVPLPFRPIVLIRNPVDTIRSLERRVLESDTVRNGFESYGKGFVTYWCETYRNLHERLVTVSLDPHVVFYEELLEDPVRVTESLFTYLGVRDTQGVSEYRPYGKWQWGKDDAGEKIRHLSVLEPPAQKRREDEHWASGVRRADGVAEVMNLYRNHDGRRYRDYLQEAGYLST